MWLRGPTTTVQGINMMYKYKLNITNVGKYMAYTHGGTTEGMWKKGTTWMKQMCGMYQLLTWLFTLIKFSFMYEM